MSAWIVSKTHIDVLVQAALATEMTRPDEADEFGRMLWAENLASIAYRYPHDTGDGDRPGPIEFRDSDVETYVFEALPGDVLAAMSLVGYAAECYDYQTCEHPTYRASKALRVATALAALGKAAPTPTDTKMPWGIDDRDVFERFAVLV